MGTSLSNLKPNPGANRKRKRVGRGPGSGNGTNAGKGNKGQKHRTGHHMNRAGFEGGQTPMQRRLPKRGFTNIFRVDCFALNVSVLADKFAAGAVVDMDALRKAGLVPRKVPRVKILGVGDLKHALTVKVHAVSATAKDKIEKAGGKVETHETAVAA